MSQKGEIRFIGEVESASEESSTVRIYDEFCPGLLGVEGYSHLIVLTWMHLRDDEENRRTLQVTPRRHPGAPLTGVFACRSPSRPNPIGLSVVKLRRIEGCRFVVEGLDAFEGSPLIDVKPYSPRGDAFPEARTPEWALRGPPT